MDETVVEKKQQKVSIKSVAHLKMMLHATNHCRAVIHGVLLGQYSTSNTVEVTDVLPVFHSVPTKPILSIALRLADAYGDTTKTTIVGWYTSNETSGNTAPNHASLKIINSISSFASDKGEPILITIPAFCLESFLTSNDEKDSKGGLQIYKSNTKKHWLTPYPTSSITFTDDNDDNNKKMITAAIVTASKTKELPFYDFEDHLASQSGEADNKEILKERDWIRNPCVAKFINAKQY